MSLSFLENFERAARFRRGHVETALNRCQVTLDVMSYTGNIFVFYPVFFPELGIGLPQSFLVPLQLDKQKVLLDEVDLARRCFYEIKQLER